MPDTWSREEDKALRICHQQCPSHGQRKLQTKKKKAPRGPFQSRLPVFWRREPESNWSNRICNPCAALKINELQANLQNSKENQQLPPITPFGIKRHCFVERLNDPRYQLLAARLCGAHICGLLRSGKVEVDGCLQLGTHVVGQRDGLIQTQPDSCRPCRQSSACLSAATTSPCKEGIPAGRP